MRVPIKLSTCIILDWKCHIYVIDTLLFYLALFVLFLSFRPLLYYSDSCWEKTEAYECFMSYVDINASAYQGLDVFWMAYFWPSMYFANKE